MEHSGTILDKLPYLTGYFIYRAGKYVYNEQKKMKVWKPRKHLRGFPHEHNVPLFRNDDEIELKHNKSQFNSFSPTSNNDDASTIMWNPKEYTKKTYKSEVDCDIAIKRRVKKARLSRNTPFVMANMQYPPVTMSANGYKPNPYNDSLLTDDSNRFPNGQRGFKQNRQDIIQIVHMSANEFMDLHAKGLANLKTFRTNNYWFRDGPENNDFTSQFNDITTNAETAFTATTNVPFIGGHLDDWKQYMNPNLNLLVEHYVYKYTITNSNEFPIYLEFTELTPKQIIFERFIQTYNSGTNNESIITDLQDPLSIMNRDISKSNNMANRDHNLGGALITPVITSGYQKDKALDQRGVNPTSSYMTELQYKYNIVNKKIVQLQPGNKVEYTLTINGFKRNSDFQHAQTQLKVTTGVSPNPFTVFTSIPTWLKQTKFLTIRAWTNTHVQGEPISSEPTEANLANEKKLSFAPGDYLISASMSVKFRSIPKPLDHKHILLNRSLPYLQDPDLFSEHSVLDEDVEDPTIINKEMDQTEAIEDTGDPA